MAASWSAKDNGSSQRKKRGSGGRVGIARSVSGGLDVLRITSLRSVPAGTFPCTDMYIRWAALGFVRSRSKSPPCRIKRDKSGAPMTGLHLASLGRCVLPRGDVGDAGQMRDLAAGGVGDIDMSVLQQ